MKLLFIRHGQTDFNKNKLPQGQEIDAPLNETGINQAREDIKEFSYGSLAGKPWPEIVKITGDKDKKEKDDSITFDYSRYGGEPAYDLKIRVAKFVEEVKKKYANKTVLVVSHGGVMDAMHILYPQKEKSETSNASVHEFKFDY